MPPPKKPKPKLTARVIDCLEHVCTYAHIGLELSDMETPVSPEDNSKTEAGIQYLHKLINWYDARHLNRTGHARWCSGPPGHTGPCTRPVPPKEERPPEPPVDPEYEAMVQEITRESQTRYTQQLEVQRRDAMEGAKAPEEDE